MVPIERFGHFDIAKGADGRSVELPRSRDEFVFLAFDTRISRLVELHVLKGGERWTAEEKQSALERAGEAMKVTSAGFMRVLECGEDDGLVYYSSMVSDGEPLDAYVTRRGALPPATAFSLMIPLMDDLHHLLEIPRLAAETRLDELFVTLQEETFLQLRALDFGLSSVEREREPGEVEQRLVYEACQAMFQLLTGRPHSGEDCDRFPVLTGLPMGLRTLMRASLGNAANAPASVQRMREEVREALAAQTREVHGRASRRHLVASDAMVPVSALRDILLHDVSMEQIFKGRISLADSGGQQRYPFTIQATDDRTEAPLSVHLLPPRRIVSNEHYDAVPPQMWRFNAERHPNILRSRSVWESTDLTFITEDLSPGFPLSRLIAERVYLNPAEAVIILREVRAALDQAMECGVEKLDIHPCNIVLKLATAPHAREIQRLLQKRLDAWPGFTVMLRTHMTMRSLYEPPLSELERPTLGEGGNDARDFRNRSYVALAAYLLSGERLSGGAARLPESVPEELTAYVNECAERSQHPGQAPAPQEFLREFERRAAIPEVEPAGGGVVLPARREAQMGATALIPMESAGVVSDFAEDQAKPEAAAPSSAAGRTTSLLTRVPLDSGRRKPNVSGRAGMLLWAALFVMFLYLGYTRFWSKIHGGGAASALVEAPPVVKAPASLQESAVTKAPAAMQASAPVETPASLKKPVAAKAPVARPVPSLVESPPAAETPVNAKAPVAAKAAGVMQASTPAEAALAVEPAASVPAPAEASPPARAVAPPLVPVAAKPSGEVSQPPTKPAPVAPAKPEEVRRALVPSDEEKEQLRREAPPSPPPANGESPPTVRASSLPAGIGIGPSRSSAV